MMSHSLGSLQQHLNTLTGQYPFAVTWQVRPIGSFDAVGSGANHSVAAFSTRKVSVLLACLALIHREELEFSQRLTITEQLKDGVQAGIFRNLGAGAELTLRDALVQMMCTSDNVCTQLVFKAIGTVRDDALQWVNDYSAWVGMQATVHREIFPRTGDLTWGHSNHTLTVTCAQDQNLLLHQLARATTSPDAAAQLFVSTELAQFALNAMHTLYTPGLGAATRRLRFAEKNGRGLRALSQVGIAVDTGNRPLAAVAVYVDNIPTVLPSGVPGRIAAFEFFAKFGVTLEHWHDGDAAAGFHVAPTMAITAPQRWPEVYPELRYAVETEQAGAFSQHNKVPVPFAGTGKIFFALTVAHLCTTTPGLAAQQIEISSHHREAAVTGTFRHLAQSIRLGLVDAMNLVVTTGDGACTLAVLEHLQHQQLDVVSGARNLLKRLGLESVNITGTESATNSRGEGFIGETSLQDLVALLNVLHPDTQHRTVTDVVDAQTVELVLGWMRSVFEPAGLAHGLPGFGPKRVAHWTLSGWENDSANGRQACTSVLISHSPHRGWVVAAAHRAQPATGRGDATQEPVLGAFGLSVYGSSDEMLNIENTSIHIR